MGIKLASTIYEDSKACIATANNLEHQQRTTHFRRKYLKFRECVMENTIKTAKISSKDMTAVCLIKILPRLAFLARKTKMWVTPSNQLTIVEGNWKGKKLNWHFWNKARYSFQSDSTASMQIKGYLQDLHYFIPLLQTILFFRITDKYYWKNITISKSLQIASLTLWRNVGSHILFAIIMRKDQSIKHFVLPNTLFHISQNTKKHILTRYNNILLFRVLFQINRSHTNNS